MSKQSLPSPEVRERKARVRRDILEFGIDTISELAARHGTDQPTMSAYRKELMEELRSEYKARGFEISAELVAKIDLIYRRGAIAFERSKQNAERIQTTLNPRKCSECKGTGWSNPETKSGDWCTTCDGEGVVYVETIIREEKGQPGDPAFLKIMLDCVKEIGRLTGQYTYTKEPVGTQINVVSGVDLSSIDNDKVVGLIAQIQKLALGGDREVIDVDSKEV